VRQDKPKVETSWLGALASGACAGVLGGAVFGLLCTIQNPWFLDSGKHVLIYLFALPGTVGIVLGAVLGLIALMLPSRLRVSLVTGVAVGLFSFPLALLLWGFLHDASPFSTAPIVVAALMALILGTGWGWGTKAVGVRRAWIWLLLLPAAALWIACGVIKGVRTSAERQCRTRLMVMGFDGVSWPLAQDMIARGELLNFARLMGEGASGPSRSLEPIVSARIWTSIDTGVLPEKHGVGDFLQATRFNLRAKPLWEILKDRGWTIGLYEWFLSWPIEEVEYYWVPSWMARTSEAHPPSLSFLKEMKMGTRERERPISLQDYAVYAAKSIDNGLRLSTLIEEAGFTLFLKFRRPSFYDMYFRAHSLYLKMDRDIDTFLLRKHSPDVGLFFNQGVDAVSHYYWHFMEPEGFPAVDEKDRQRFGGVIRDFYREVDRTVGEFLRCLPDEASVAIVSDHGFQSAASIPGRFFMYRVKTADLLRRIGFQDRFEGIYLTAMLLFRPKADVEEESTRDLHELAGILESFVLSPAGIPFFEVETIDGPGTASDYVQVKITRAALDFTRKHGQEARESSLVYTGGEARFTDINEASNRWTGAHELQGVLFLKGPAVRAGIRLNDACVLDITPTILALQGLPVGEDMDGKVLAEAIQPASLAARPVSSVASYGPPSLGERARQAKASDEGVRSRLRALGYVE
jgi:hypothetical protein